jgi:hypothetical protein
MALGVRWKRGSFHLTFGATSGTAQARNIHTRNGAANTAIAWCRAASGRLAVTRKYRARVPPQPGQSNPVVSLNRHVLGPVSSVGFIATTPPTAAATHPTIATGAIHGREVTFAARRESARGRTRCGSDSTVSSAAHTVRAPLVPASLTQRDTAARGLRTRPRPEKPGGRPRNA